MKGLSDLQNGKDFLEFQAINILHKKKPMQIKRLHRLLSYRMKCRNQQAASRSAVPPGERFSSVKRSSRAVSCSMSG